MCSFDVSVSPKSNWGKCHILIGRDSNLYLWCVPSKCMTEDKPGDSALAMELVGVVVAPEESGSVVSITYAFGKVSGGVTHHFLVAVTTRGRVLLLTVALSSKKPRDLSESNWSYFMLKPRLERGSESFTGIGIMRTEETQLLAVISGGKLYLIELDMSEHAAKHRLILKSFVESTVFRIPGSIMETGDLSRVALSPRKESVRGSKGGKTSGLRRQNALSPQGRQLTNGKLSSLSLFELASLKPKEKRLNAKTLRLFLDKHGETMVASNLQ